jgi:hypothetical protein
MNINSIWGAETMRTDVVTSSQPTTAAEALSALEHVTAMLLREGDPLAAFPDIYAIITRRVVEEAARPGGVFLEPQWVSRLAGRFCARYLETLRWARAGHPQDTSAWTCAYAAANDRGAPPVQHALLGLSAHINYDLALGIHATIVESGHARDRRMIARYKHDHDQLNALLDASIPEAFERLITQHRCEATVWLQRFGRLARLCTIGLLTRWRDRVWVEMEALLAADTSAQRARVLGRVGARAGRIGAVLRRRLVTAERESPSPAPAIQPPPGAPRMELASLGSAFTAPDEEDRGRKG